MRRNQSGQASVELMLILSVAVTGIVSAAYNFVPTWTAGVQALALDVSRILESGQVGGIGLNGAGRGTRPNPGGSAPSTNGGPGTNRPTANGGSSPNGLPGNSGTNNGGTPTVNTGTSPNGPPNNPNSYNGGVSTDPSVTITVMPNNPTTVNGGNPTADIPSSPTPLPGTINTSTSFQRLPPCFFTRECS